MAKRTAQSEVSSTLNQTASSPQIRLSKKQVAAWNFLWDDTTTELLYGGAAGGGKSMLGCIWQIYRRLRYPGSRGLIGRKILKELKQSTLITFFRCASLMGLRVNRDYWFNPSAGTITFRNESVIVLFGLREEPSDPDFQGLGSTEFTDAFIDEGGEIVEKAFEITKSRIRYRLGDYGICPKILICSNPQDNWLKRRYIKDDRGFEVNLKPHMKYIQAKLTDNVDPAFREVYRANLESLHSEYDRARLLDGDWDAQPRTGMEYYHPFNRDLHAGTPVFNPDIAVHIAYDFNVSPFMTLLVVQVEQKEGLWHVNVLKEYCLTHPKNTTEEVTREFMKSEYYQKSKALYFYGDYSGKSRTPISPEHNFAIIERLLRPKLNNGSDRVIPNQPILDRKKFLLDVLANRTHLRLKISTDCIQMIKEFNFMKEAPDGTKLKEKVKDPITLTMHERWSHPTDALEYLVTSLFFDYFRTNVSRQ